MKRNYRIPGSFREGQLGFMKRSKQQPLTPVADTKRIASNAEGSGVDSREQERTCGSDEYPIRLMQKFIVDLFKVLEREKHYIYTTILHVSAIDFRINRIFDWRLYQEKRNKLSGRISPETYSLRSFDAMSKVFHRYDEFEIFVFSERFNRDDELTLKKVEQLYLGYLRRKCELLLREDKQLKLTPEIISEYEFTEEDVSIVQKYLNRFNLEARNKIKKESNSPKIHFLES